MHAAHLFSLVPMHNKIPGGYRFAHTFVRPLLCVQPLLTQKRAQRLTFWARRQPGGVDVFHAKRWGQKVHSLPRKFVPGKTNFILGMCREFCWDVRTPDPWGCSKSLCFYLGVWSGFVYDLAFYSIVGQNFLSANFCFRLGGSWIVF